MFRLVGLILIVLTWIIGAYLLWRWHNKDPLTISKHASSTKQAYILFAVSLSTIGIALYIWLLLWLAPHHGLGSLFKVTLTLMTACLLTTAIIPDTQGILRKLHRIAAFSMAILYLPLALLISLSSGLEGAARVLCVGLLTYMLATFIIIVLLKKSQKRYLMFQGLYIVAFQLIVLAAAYL